MESDSVNVFDIVITERPSHCCVGCDACKEEFGNDFKVSWDVN